MATTDLDRTRTTLPPATPSGNDGVSPRAVLAGIGGLAILIGPFVFVSQWAISFLFDVERVGPEYLPSISHAFHSPVAKPFFVAMLGAAALMFMAYRGWTTRSPGADRALAILCSASGCLVVLFPTSPCPMPATGFRSYGLITSRLFKWCISRRRRHCSSRSSSLHAAASSTARVAMKISRRGSEFAMAFTDAAQTS